MVQLNPRRERINKTCQLIVALYLKLGKMMIMWYFNLQLPFWKNLLQRGLVRKGFAKLDKMLFDRKWSQQSRSTRKTVRACRTRRASPLAMRNGEDEQGTTRRGGRSDNHTLRLAAGTMGMRNQLNLPYYSSYSFHDRHLIPPPPTLSLPMWSCNRLKTRQTVSRCQTNKQIVNTMVRMTFDQRNFGRGLWFWVLNRKKW